jgi:type I restriction enzyme S subunit
MELKPGYKQTEVGVIPEDWDIRSLQDLCKEEITYGIVQCGPHIPGGIPYIRVSDMDGPILEREKMLCTSSQIASRFRRSEVRHGDIVYALRGRLGDVRSVPLDLDGANLTQGTARLSPSFRVHSSSLLWALRNPEVVLRACAESKGTTFMEITLADLRQIKIALPPEPEQIKIASTLSDIEDHLTTLDHELAKKRNIKQAAMQELLTGKRRLPGFEGEWEVKRLGDVLTICHGKSQRDVEITDGPYPILATGGQIGTAERPLYSKPSVLIGRKGTINKPQYMDTPFWTVDTLFYSAMKEENSARFFYYLFCAIDWMQFNEASGVPSLNAKTIDSVEVDCPDTQEQDAIASLLSGMDEELQALEANLAKVGNLKQGMMQQLLTGKIRLA